MNAAGSRFMRAFGGIEAGATEDIVRVARRAASEGLAVLPVRPGDKAPLCPLSSRAAMAADATVKDEAHKRGDLHWEKRRHQCGFHHATTDPALATTYFRSMVRRHGEQVNIGVSPYGSRMVMVDADTADQLSAFWGEWWKSEEATAPAGKEPTVRTPGKVVDGEWKHKEGGHIWFDLAPDQNLAGIPGGSLMDDSGWVVKWNNCQALVPPSRRAEGPYVLTGAVYPLPTWLYDRILLAGQQWQERRARAVGETGNDPVDQWARENSWESILLADDWKATGLVDSCTCPIWTRPGDDVTNLKSATAHEETCAQWETSGGQGPLHLWTDNPPAFLAALKSRSISKLTYVAASQYEGDVSRAMREENIARRKPTNTPPLAKDVLDLFPPEIREYVLNSEPTVQRALMLSLREWYTDSKATEMLRLLEAIMSATDIEPLTLNIDDQEDTMMKATVLVRSDGSGLGYESSVNLIMGEPESGKSWLALFICGQALAEGKTVTYLDFENGPMITKLRLRQMGIPAASVRERFNYWDMPGMGLSLSNRSLRKRGAADVIIVDGLNAALSADKMSLLDNTDVTSFYSLLSEEWPTASVWLLDHVTKNRDQRGRWAIGAQAKIAALSGVALTLTPIVAPSVTQTGRIDIAVAKDRHASVRALGTGTMPVVASMWLGPDEMPDRVKVDITPCPEVPSEEQQEERLNEEEQTAVLAWFAAQETDSSFGVRDIRGAGRQRLIAVLDLLVAQGELEEVVGARNSRKWKLTSDMGG